MSWSVNKMGKGAAVGAALAEEFKTIASYNMPEPEQAMANKAAEIVAAACAGAPDYGLAVKGYGSACTQGGKVSSLNFKLEIDLVSLAE